MKSTIERVHRTKGQARRSYNRLSRWYDLFTGSEKQFTDIGIHMLNVQANESVLEIGCGTGHALIEFAKSIHGGNVIAMDISEGMLLAARKRIRNKVREGSVDFCQADGSCIPFPDQHFDAIFISFTLELFDTPELPKVLNECFRILKPNGRVGIVSLAQKDTNAVRIYEWFHRVMPVLVDCRPIHLHEPLKEANFFVDRSTIQTMWGLPVEIVIAKKR
jgi:demethylmenaquinone methyltransferase/2-methoxy-6-polyprenyl-1,4-benzoquinol methylase